MTGVENELWILFVAGLVIGVNNGCGFRSKVSNEKNLQYLFENQTPNFSLPVPRLSASYGTKIVTKCGGKTVRHNGVKDFLKK